MKDSRRFFASLALALLLSLNLAPNASARWAYNGRAISDTEKEGVDAYNLGLGLLKQNQNAQALAKFKEAVDKFPSMAEAHVNYAGMLIQNGDYQAALPHAKLATEINPNLSVAWRSLAGCYQISGRLTEAIDALKKFLELEPTGRDAATVKSMIAALQQEVARTQGANTPTDAPDYLADATQNGCVRWPRKRLPITIYIEPGTQVEGFRPDMEAALRRAISDWQQAAQGKIEFQFVDQPSKASIKCEWTHDPKRLMMQAEGGQALVAPDEEGLLTCNVLLLTVSPTGAYLAEGFAHRIALHEMGHALGLLGHSRNPQDVMFSSMVVSDKDCNLSDRDKATMVALYGERGDQALKQGMKWDKLMMSGDPNSAVVRSLRLNIEAAELMKQKKYAPAVEKLEQALTIDPNAVLVPQNLAIAYCNLSIEHFNSGRHKQSEQYMQQAISMAEKVKDRTILIDVLKAYNRVLAAQKKQTEAEQVNARILQLQKH